MVMFEMQDSICSAVNSSPRIWNVLSKQIQTWVSRCFSRSIQSFAWTINPPVFLFVTRYANSGKLLHPAINLLYDNDTYIAGWIFFLPEHTFLPPCHPF